MLSRLEFRARLDFKLECSCRVLGYAVVHRYCFCKAEDVVVSNHELETSGASR